MTISKEEALTNIKVLVFFTQKNESCNDKKRLSSIKSLLNELKDYIEQSGEQRK